MPLSSPEAASDSLFLPIGWLAHCSAGRDKPFLTPVCLQAELQKQRELNVRMKHQLAEQVEEAEQAQEEASAAQEAQEEARQQKARADELEVREKEGKVCVADVGDD